MVVNPNKKLSESLIATGLFNMTMADNSTCVDYTKLEKVLNVIASPDAAPEIAGQVMFNLAQTDPVERSRRFYKNEKGAPNKVFAGSLVEVNGKAYPLKYVEHIGDSVCELAARDVMSELYHQHRPTYFKGCQALTTNKNMASHPEIHYGDDFERLVGEIYLKEGGDNALRAAKNLLLATSCGRALSRFIFSNRKKAADKNKG